MGFFRRLKLWFTGSYHIEEYQTYHMLTRYDGIAYTLEIYDDSKKLVIELHYYSFSELVEDLQHWREWIEVYRTARDN